MNHAKYQNDLIRWHLGLRVLQPTGWRYGIGECDRDAIQEAVATTLSDAGLPMKPIPPVPAHHKAQYAARGL